MKKLVFFLMFILIVFSLCNWQGCKTPEEEPTPHDSTWSADDQLQLDALLTLLDDSKIRFHDYVQSQNDTLVALQLLAEWYRSDPFVSFAEAGDQGVCFEFKNGFRGLYFVDGKDEPSVKYSNEPGNFVNDLDENLKSVPSLKAMALINPHYLERVSYFNDLANTYQATFYKVFKNGFYRVMDNACGLYTFAELKKSKYGYVHIYSHGCAWPNRNQISEVYLMTGQSPDEYWTTKFEKDIKKRTVLFGRAEGINRTVYWISPYFISDNNDFSKDTVLIYGGFCYSFLGGWPNLVNSFASGGYFGFNWSVRTDKNAGWAKSLWQYMSDTTTVVPWSTATWLNNTPEVPKEYYDEKYKKQVMIKYVGNNDLTFWEPKHKYSIIATASEGEPIDHPGKTGIEYEFKCLDRNHEIGEGLRFQWIFGDGNPAYEVVGLNKVSHTWQNEGAFTMSVMVYHIASGKLLGIAEAVAKVDKYYDYLPLLQTMKSIQATIHGNGHHYYDDGSQCPDLTAFNYYITDGGELAWDGQNFSAAGSYNNNWDHVALSGYVSQDADSLLYLKAVYTYTGGLDETRDSLSFELRNIPLFHIYEGQPPYAEYQVTGVQSQSHVFNLYYKKMTTRPNYLYYDHSDWEYVTLKIRFTYLF